MPRRETDNSEPSSSFWLDRLGNRQRTHRGRGPTPREYSREALMRHWFGEDLAMYEVLARQRPAQPIRVALDQVTERLARQESPLLGRLQMQWLELVGPDVARDTCPVALHGNTLLVEVKNATLRYILERECKVAIEEKVQTCTDGAAKQVRFVPAGRRGRNDTGRPANSGATPEKKACRPGTRRPQSGSEA